ncbi:MAG TPA: F0F1 ATP synthase subunit B [Candidatus Limnocylindrales bacterium]|nr:F0F1 ATP synthase subunit B [Candidatus Limnocylindrales bacterium]
MDLLAIGGIGLRGAIALAQETEATGLQINFFWIIVASLNFILLFILLSVFALGPLRRILDERRTRIEEGLRDAEQARRDRESAESERVAALQEARREANEILARSQKVAQDTRDADIAATKADLERMRQRATAEIESEKQRAIADLRNEVADLALRAAGRVVGETLTSERERRLVSEFLAEAGEPTGGSTN